MPATTHYDPDLSTVEHACAGDRHAFSCLVDTYQKPVYNFQDTIANEANAFFQPRGISAAAAQALAADDVEALDWTTPDGARLAGWLVKNSPDARAPLAGIMQRYFDSIARAPGIHSPLLCLIGAADPVIAPKRSLKLVGQWGGATTVKTYTSEDHSLLLHENSSWTDIAAFLGRVAGQ